MTLDERCDVTVFLAAEQIAFPMIQGQRGPRLQRVISSPVPAAAMIVFLGKIQNEDRKMKPDAGQKKFRILCHF
jgi:hypothetical protein